MEQRLAMTTIALAAVLLTSTGVVYVGMAMAGGDPYPDPASEANPDGICT